MALTCVKWPKYLTNGLNMSENYCDVREIVKIFVKWLIYICGMAYVLLKRHKYFGNDLNISNMAEICGKRIKYIRNGFNMWEMA